MSVLVAEGVTVRLGGALVVDGVNIEVEAGEWLGVIGPNGAGKTTLLRAVTGLTQFEGAVSIDGHDMTSLKAAERARLIGYAPQVAVIVPEMPVRDFVLLGRAPYWGRWGKAGPDDDEAVEEALAALDLSRFGHRQMASLSGGERQRAVLAQALAQSTPVLVLDEPTTSLDVGHQLALLELVDAMRMARRLAVVTSLHDLGLAGQYADRLVLLDSGRVGAAGPPADVLTAETIRRHYGVDAVVEPTGKRVSVNVVRQR